MRRRDRAGACVNAAHAATRKKRRTAFSICLALLAILSLGVTAALAQLRGHGGPVRALAISPDGETAHLGKLQFNRDPLVADAQCGRTGAPFPCRRRQRGRCCSGMDARRPQAPTGALPSGLPATPQPDAVLEGHTAPIAALAVSPDGATLASASWDQTVRLWPLAGGVPRVLDGHTQNVNGVAFAPDGRTLVSVSYDQSVRIWPLSAPVRADCRCDARARSTPWPSPTMARSRPGAPTARFIF